MTEMIGQNGGGSPSELALAFEELNVALCIVDDGGKFTRINRAALHLLGYSANDLIGRSFHAVLHSPIEAAGGHLAEQCPARSVQRAGGRETGVDVYSRKDGVALHVEYLTTALAADTVIGAMVQFSEGPAQNNPQSQSDGAMRIELASRLAHEFNNVLMGILPFSEVIARQAANNLNLRAAGDRIAGSVRRGKQFTDRILTLTRSSPGDPKPVAFGEWLRAFAPDAERVLKEAIQVRLGVADELTVQADPAQLRTLFMSLLENARDAMPSGGIVTIAVALNRGGGSFSFGNIADAGRFAHVTVTDGGSGMSEATLRRAFEPFFTTKRSATGVGLAHALHIVKQLGGHIFAESREGNGTVIHTFLPLSPSELETADTDESGRQEIRRLVLIEDDEDVALGLTSVLATEQVDVMVANTGAAGIDLIAREQPDAVLLDLGLPDMSGLDVYAVIAMRWPTLPIIFSTGQAEVSQMRDQISTPHLRYLVKPYELKSLLDVLKSLES